MEVLFTGNWCGVQWCAVVCGGVQWCAVVCGGVWWCVVVCGDVGGVGVVMCVVVCVVVVCEGNIDNVGGAGDMAGGDKASPTPWLSACFFWCC